MFLTENDIIAGSEGMIFGVFDGIVRELAEIKRLEARVAKTKADFKVLGYRGNQHKATGFNGTGTVTAYYNNSIWAEYMETYVKNGIDVYFNMIVLNEDKTSRIGKQRIQLNRCNMDDLTIATVDVDADFLTHDMAFTFNDYDLLDKFTVGW